MKFDDGDTEDYNASELLQIILPETDQLEEAIKSVNDKFIGSNFAHTFGGATHTGRVINQGVNEENGEDI